MEKKVIIESNQRLDKFIAAKFPQYSRAYIKEQIKLGNILVYPVRSLKIEPEIPQSEPPASLSLQRGEQAKSPQKLKIETKHGWTSNGVNGKKVKPSYELRQGDGVALAPEFHLPETGKILPNPEIKLNIIYEDENVIVIDKPAGLAVHPRQDKNGFPLLQETNSTLVSGLLAYYPSIANVGDANYNPSQPPLNLRRGEILPNPSRIKCGTGSFAKEGEIPPLKLRGGEGALCANKNSAQNIRPGLVHRLDKDTSGVMIVAKNQNSFDWLKDQFKKRQTTKKYLALVHGSLKNKEGEIKALLHRSISDPTKQKVISHESLLPSDEGRVGWGAEKILNTTPSQSPPQLRGRRKIREAITQYKVIKEFKNYSLLEVSPKTGRLHQIRVHLASLGHPVAGDTKYGPKNRPAPKGLTRQFLHAEELKITLPNGRKITFKSPLPSDLTATLKTLDKTEK